MITPITIGELAELVPHLRGDKRKWAEQSSAGPSGMTVYADTEMLNACRAAKADASNKKRPKSKHKAESKDEDIQGQPGPDMVDEPNVVEGP